MKTNTFILIVVVYSIILALPNIFLPDFSLEYFAAHPGIPEEQSLINIIGGYQLFGAYIGYVAYRSTDRETRRGWLLATAFITIFAIVIQQYDVYMRGMKVYATIYVDEAIWLAIAIGSIYFRGKE